PLGNSWSRASSKRTRRSICSCFLVVMSEFLGFVGSMGKQCRYCHVREHVAGSTAKNKLAQSRVAIGSHDDQVCLLLLGASADLTAHRCSQRLERGNRQFDAVFSERLHHHTCR